MAMLLSRGFVDLNKILVISPDINLIKSFFRVSICFEEKESVSEEDVPHACVMSNKSYHAPPFSENNFNNRAAPLNRLFIISRPLFPFLVVSPLSLVPFVPDTRVFNYRLTTGQINWSF